MAALKKKRIKPRLTKRDDPIYREPWHCVPVKKKAMKKETD